MPSTDEATITPARMTIVDSPACHFCAEAHQVVEQLARYYPLSVETVDVRSEAGQLLMSRHRASMSPLVLLDGAFFSHGRLPRRKLTDVLTRRYGAPVTDIEAG